MFVFLIVGGFYYWGVIFGGKKWGWMMVWFNLIGLIFVIVVINFGIYDLFFKMLIVLMFGVRLDSLMWWY